MTPPTQAKPLSPAAQRRKSLLETAITIVTKDRNVAHGEAEDNFTNIAKLWVAYLRAAHGVNVTLDVQDVALMMVLFKTARAAVNKRNTENWIDIAGYAGCGGGPTLIPGEEVVA